MPPKRKDPDLKKFHDELEKAPERIQTLVDRGVERGMAIEYIKLLRLQMCSTLSQREQEILNELKPKISEITKKFDINVIVHDPDDYDTSITSSFSGVSTEQPGL